MAKTTSQFNLKKWLKIGSLLLVMVIFLEFLCAPLSLTLNILHTNQLHKRLALAKTTWQTQAIQDYEITVKGFVPPVCVYNATLIVKKGEMSHVKFDNLNPTPPTKPLENSTWIDQSCTYSQLTAAEMFKKAEETLRTLNPLEAQLLVEFDADRGFITHYEYNQGFPIRFLGPVVSDCCVQYTFSNFNALEANPNSSN